MKKGMRMLQNLQGKNWEVISDWIFHSFDAQCDGYGLSIDEVKSGYDVLIYFTSWWARLLRLTDGNWDTWVKVCRFSSWVEARNFIISKLINLRYSDTRKKLKITQQNGDVKKLK